VIEMAEKLDGWEREVSRELQRSKGLEAAGCMVPFEALCRRDLSVTASPGAGGNIVGSLLQPSVETVLLPFSSLVAAGATVIDNLVGNFSWPRMATPATPAWQATENAADTATGPTFSSLNLSPCRLTTEVRVSNQLIIQNNYSIEALLKDSILKSVGAAIDNAGLNGSGTTGVPLGILNMAENTGTNADYAKLAPGVTYGGSGVGTWATVCQQRFNVENLMGGGEGDEMVSWISSPNTKRGLSQILRDGNTAEFVWDDNEIAGGRAIATTNMATDQLVAGVFKDFIVALWSLDLVIDKYTFLSTYQTRIICTCLGNTGLIRGVSVSRSENSAAAG
jgi:hypothetical protein